MFSEEWQKKHQVIDTDFDLTNIYWIFSVWFSFFIYLSTFLVYLMPKLFSKKNSSGTI